MINEIYDSADGVALSLDEIDFDESEMAPPFLDEASCLIPGEPVVRVEKAPENSRRIFAGIDIMASVDDVWNVSCCSYTMNECHRHCSCPVSHFISCNPLKNIGTYRLFQSTKCHTQLGC